MERLIVIICMTIWASVEVRGVLSKGYAVASEFVAGCLSKENLVTRANAQDVGKLYQEYENRKVSKS